MALPFARPAPQPVESAPASVPEIELLKRSAVFKAMLERRPKLKERREWIFEAVAALFESEGRLPPEVFAARTSTLPGRVPGAVSMLQEALNVDGSPVIVNDAQEKLVKLDREPFRAIFKDE